MNDTIRPTLTVLADDDLEAIHLTSINILSKTGVEVCHEGARKMLHNAGAKIIDETRMVYFPPELVENSLKQAPKQVKLYARNSDFDCTLEPAGKLHCRNVGGPEIIFDNDLQDYRAVTLEDLRNWTLLIDGLSNIDYCMGIFPNNIHNSIRDIYVVSEMFQFTQKHLHVQPYSPKNIKLMMEMSQAVASAEQLPPDRPLFSVFISSKTPLCYPESEVEMLMTAGQLGVPVMLNSTPIAGGNGPVTIAGTVALLNAEILAGITIAQLANPGAPIVYSPRALSLDMQTSIASAGYIENSLSNACSIQLVNKKYQIPTDMFGPMTDSHTIDLQAQTEKTYNSLLPALAGASVVSGAGMLESVGAVSATQLVIDDELMGIVKRVAKGVSVTENTLAENVIDECSKRHNFLDSEHTLENFREEYCMPELYIRTGREAWKASGKGDMIDRATNKIKRILEKHEQKKLPQEAIKAINKTIKDAESKIGHC